MNKENIIVGLSGPSAVGKGYCKDKIKKRFPDIFIEPVVVTTRPRRDNDGFDRRAGISVNEFFDMEKHNLIIFPHQPFGTDWYGFLASSFESENKPILTEIHPENIRPFKSRYGNRLVLIGLVADPSYLETNIKSRGTESSKIAQERISASIEESIFIQTLTKDGLIDFLVEVNQGNRVDLGKIMIDLTSEIITRK